MKKSPHVVVVVVSMVDRQMAVVASEYASYLPIVWEHIPNTIVPTIHAASRHVDSRRLAVEGRAGLVSIVGGWYYHSLEKQVVQPQEEEGYERCKAKCVVLSNQKSHMTHKK